VARDTIWSARRKPSTERPGRGSLRAMIYPVLPRRVEISINSATNQWSGDIRAMRRGEASLTGALGAAKPQRE